MSEDTLLKKVTKIIVANNEVLLSAIETRIDKKIQASEQRLEQKLTEKTAKLSRKIVTSQEDTIEVLSALMHTGYDLHEAKIVRIEDELNLPPIKQKH